jgi:hypothetical protein
MLTLLERHVPEVKPALAGAENAFAPWKKRACKPESQRA